MDTRTPAAYVRRSSATVESPGDASREAQLAAIHSLCGESAVVYTDWGISGLKANRPDYLRLKADIAAGGISSVCSYSLSRLGRSVRELLDFVDLCRRHDVVIRTKVESIDTSTAMGNFTFTLFAAIGQLEAELARERQGAARAARVARGDDMSAPYGWKLERQPDGRLSRARDESQDLTAVLDAIRETSGNILAACRLLEERGIPAPKGGKRWATSALTRVVEREAPELRPQRTARTGQRRPASSPLAHLVTCPHCGVTLTPAATRNGLYCRNGARMRATHPKYFIKEGPVLDLLREEARWFRAPVSEVAMAETAARRDAIEQRLTRAGDLFIEGAIDKARLDAEKARAKRDLDRLDEDASVVTVPPEIDWDWPAPQLNAVLRILWREVRLDDRFMPVEAVWSRPEWRA